jgi:Flp pilus assembly protein TadG
MHADRLRDDGAALVEMAIVVPLLLVLILGLVEFARGYNAKSTLVHATREGVRELAITGDADSARATTRAAATSLDPTLIDVTTTECEPGLPTTLTARYPFTYSILFIGSGTIDLETTAVMRCGG